MGAQVSNLNPLRSKKEVEYMVREQREGQGASSSALFDKLGFTRTQLNTLFLVFNNMDRDGGNSVNVRQWRCVCIGALYRFSETAWHPPQPLRSRSLKIIPRPHPRPRAPLLRCLLHLILALSHSPTSFTPIPPLPSSISSRC